MKDPCAFWGVISYHNSIGNLCLHENTVFKPLLGFEEQVQPAFFLSNSRELQHVCSAIMNVHIIDWLVLRNT